MKSSTQRWDKGLYLVPTPIGNLADMSFRAVEALQNADFVFCEDTRMTKKLCGYYEIKTPLRAYHDHSDDHAREAMIELLKDGKTLALVSDAGTPLISDPGYKLVRDVIAAGMKVIPLPGANAVLPALQLSGFPTNQFFFGGFLPTKAQERHAVLTEHMMKMKGMSLCYYDSPKRIKSSIVMIAEIDPLRRVSICREISKLHEEAIRGTAQDVLAMLEARSPLKGEIVLVVGDSIVDKNENNHNEHIVLIVQNLLKTMSLKDVSHHLSEILDMSKKEIYSLGLSLKKDDDDNA